MTTNSLKLLLFFVCAMAVAPASPQQWKPVPVDPTVQHKGQLQSDLHKPLPEQFIWTAEAGTADAARFLRATFQLSAAPLHATLYLAGPREVQVFLNGQRIADFASDVSETVISPGVFQMEVTPFLRTGANTIALRASPALKTAPWMPEFVY